MSTTAEFKVIVEDSIKQVPRIELLVEQAMHLFMGEVLDKMKDDETSDRQLHWDYHPEIDTERLWVSYQEQDSYGFRKVASAALLSDFGQRWQQKVFLLDLMQSATRAKSKQVRIRGNELLAQLEREEDEDAKPKCD